MQATSRPVSTPTPLERSTEAAPVRRPHVCFLAPTTWPTFAGDGKLGLVGGAELQQTLLAKNLAARGYRVSMISIDYGQQDGTEAHGVRICNMHKPNEGIPVVRFVYPRLTSLWQALKRVDADVYYQRTAAVYTGYLAAFSKFYGKRSIYAGASDVDFIPKRQDITHRRDKLLFEYGLRRVDRVIVQHEHQARLLRENYGREGILIPNCYDAPAGARADRQGYVLWVATLRDSKRPEMALEVARRLPQYRFVMVGGPDVGKRGEEKARAIRDAAAKVPNVDFRGYVPLEETERLFNGARVFLNTSAYEGFPNTFLQAWARGMPTVGTVDVGLRRPDGLLAYDYVGDAEDAASRVHRLMSDDVAWQHAAQRVATHHRETHSVGAVLDQYEREILDLAARR